MINGAKIRNGMGEIVVFRDSTLISRVLVTQNAKRLKNWVNTTNFIYAGGWDMVNVWNNDDGEIKLKKSSDEICVRLKRVFLKFFTRLSFHCDIFRVRFANFRFFRLSRCCVGFLKLVFFECEVNWFDMCIIIR